MKHIHFFRLNRERTDLHEIWFRCQDCDEDCFVWRNTWRMLMTQGVAFWGKR